MSTIKLSSITNKAKTSGPVIVGVTSSTAEGYARLASGTNADRVGIESGSIRYNETAKLLEFYDGETWNFIIPAEESANALGVFGGGVNVSGDQISTIEYITISTLGSSSFFGSLSERRSFYGDGSCSSSTRGIFYGGYGPAFSSPSATNLIDYITFSNKGNTTDFGDLIAVTGNNAACSSSTRGVFGGGGNRNIIEYITIATTGNSIDFNGDLSQGKNDPASCSSSTRGVFAGGQIATPVGVQVNTIDYITIATTGVNVSSFGQLTQARKGLAACSSSTRGVFGGGEISQVELTTIDYITIATIGSASDFGDLTEEESFGSSCSSSTRGLFCGGYVPVTPSGRRNNTISYITIATTGNATYFGNLSEVTSSLAACSNNHGGLL
jgi:hypothetical protein